MIDRDLADLYGVETRALKQAVRRKIKRFPGDFMFTLTTKEFGQWRSQIVMSDSDRIGWRHPPMAFTEQGVAMLSSVLKSERAIQVNIAIMRTFTQLRRMLATHADLKRKIEEMEAKYDGRFRVVFEAIRQLLAEDVARSGRSGFEGEGLPQGRKVTGLPRRHGCCDCQPAGGRIGKTKISPTLDHQTNGLEGFQLSRNP